MRDRKRDILRAHADENARQTGEYPVDAARLIHDLSVHQVEIELQNDALREAHGELERSLQCYRHLYEFAPIAYLHLSADTTVRYANAAASALLATERNRLVGKRFSCFVTPNAAEQLTSHRRAVVESSELKACDIVLQCADRLLDVRLYSLHGPEGADDWSMAIVELGEQRRFERGMKEQAFVSAILDAAGLIVVVDAQGCIARINRNSESMLHSAVNALQARFWDVFASPTERAFVQRAIELGRPATWESSFRARDGEERWVSWTSTRLPSSLDLGQHVILSGVDITERNRLQEQLVVTERLAAVGTLAAGVAHEINNPLTYLKSSLELAARIMDRQRVDGDTKLVDLLENASEGADRIREIVDGLRTFCRSDATTLEAVDVHEVLDASLKLANHEVRHRARVVTHYGAVPAVRANNGRLVQVFVNLLVNAAQAIAEGDQKCNQVSVSTYATEDEVLVEIADTGAGIAPEHLSRLFDPFFTTKPIGCGTGLGLSVCRNILSGFGGTISVQSTPGQGATFRVKLPAARGDMPRPKSSRPPAPLTPPVNARSLQILIVDDEPRITSSMAAMLDLHEVHVANNGHTALELCLSQSLDLVFCDVLMPDMNGLELYNALRLVRPSMCERIVFMTGGASHDARALLSKVPNTVLAKPFTLEALTHVVDARAMSARG